MSGGSTAPEAHGDRLVHSALALLISNGLSAVLGVVFWVVTAHLFTARYVGYGVAEIAAMTLIASVSQFSPAAIFQRFLYASGALASKMVKIGYATGVGLALIVATGFLLFTGHHIYLKSGFGSSVEFLLAVALWVIFSIEDSALVGLRATFWVPVENTSFSIAKIAMLPIFAIVAPRSGVFVSWIFPVIGCIIPVNYYLFRRVLPHHIKWSEGRWSLPSRRVVGSILVGEYFGGLALIAMTTLPALIIVSRLGAVQAAYFQTPWLAGVSFDFSLWSIAVALTSESSARPSSAQQAVRKAVRLSLGLMIPGVIIVVFGAHLFLSLLGHTYASHGTRLLQFLALAVPFMSVNVMYVTFARMARRVRRVVTMQVGLAVIILVLTTVLIGPMGITGAGVAFLLGQFATATVVLPSVVGQFRRRGMAPGFAVDSTLVAPRESLYSAVTEIPAISPDSTPRMNTTIFRNESSLSEEEQRTTSSVWRWRTHLDVLKWTRKQPRTRSKSRNQSVERDM